MKSRILGVCLLVLSVTLLGIAVQLQAREAAAGLWVAFCACFAGAAMLLMNSLLGTNRSSGANSEQK
ncbi:hypothetical protein [Glutamicibacter endophyticus]|uniref:hypothetical protein n=1 Tax=Glutamicibacter endophyticus TaxID=1522174 RepID=UPI003AF01F2B